MRQPKIIVVGGGLAGLMAAIRVAEAGVPVELFSIVPVKRSHSVCAQGGINAAKNTKGEGDSTAKHFDDTIYGGDFLANQPPVKAMCDAAPAIIDLLDRMGVMFNRTAEGLLDYRRFGGTLYHRTAFAGATTGQQMLYALDEQVRRFEAEGKVRKYEGWTFLSAVLDDARICRGICAMDLKTMEVRAFPADAAIFCTGGIGAVFGRSTNSVVCTGSAQSALFQQGVDYANGEFVQVHPTAIPGEDKLRLMSESARGEGARIWVPKQPGDSRAPRDIPEGERFYFLEEWYPKYGNLVPRDIGTRAIHRVVYELKLGINGEPAVYLRPGAHLPGRAGPQTRRHPGDLREVLGRGPARRADESLSRNALHYGRHLGGQREPSDERAGRFCGRGVRIPVPRSEPAGGELAGFLPLGVNKNSAFVGAAILSQVRLFNLHPTGAMHARERLAAVMGPGGVADCANAQNCVHACPKEIPLTESIAEVNRQALRQALLGWLFG